MIMSRSQVQSVERELQGRVQELQEVRDTLIL